MKKLTLFLLFFLFAYITFAQINVGTNFQITGQIPIDKRTVVADTQARNLINSLYRYEGLLVYVTGEQKNYQLKGGLLNANWAALTSAADTNLWVASGANIYNKNISGKVGIGSTAVPDSTLTVTGGAKFTRDVVVNGVTVGTGKLNSFGNTVVGIGAMNGIASAGNTSNSAFGYESLKKTNTSNNTGYGYKTLTETTTGTQNTTTGSGSLYRNTTGRDNTAVGFSTLGNATASYNTAIGSQSMSGYGGGSYNMASGYKSLYSNTTGYSNTAVGVSALYSNTTASNLVAVGDSALYSNVTGVGNTAVGSKALRLSTGNNNTALGWKAAQSVTTNSDNTAIGYLSMQTNTGSGNTAIGSSSLMTGAGINNTAIGYAVMNSSSVSGNNNVAIGRGAVKNITSGSYNVSIGSFSGDSIVTGGYNTFIGADAGKNALQKRNTQNSIAIGYQAYTTASNTTTIGNTSTTDTYLSGALHVDSIPTDAAPDSILTVENGLVKKNSVALGAFAYLPSSDTTGIGTANTYYRIKGAFTTSPLSKFTVVATPAIRYDGGDTRYFEVHWCATVSSNHNGCTIKCGIKKGGSLVTSSVMATLAKTANELYNIAGVCVVQLSTNDEIQLVVTADTNGDIITFHNYTTSIRLFY